MNYIFSQEITYNCFFDFVCYEQKRLEVKFLRLSSIVNKTH